MSSWTDSTKLFTSKINPVDGGCTENTLLSYIISPVYQIYLTDYTTVGLTLKYTSGVSGVITSELCIAQILGDDGSKYQCISKYDETNKLLTATVNTIQLASCTTDGCKPNGTATYYAVIYNGKAKGTDLNLDVTSCDGTFTPWVTQGLSTYTQITDKNVTAQSTPAGQTLILSSKEKGNPYHAKIVSGSTLPSAVTALSFSVPQSNVCKKDNIPKTLGLQNALVTPIIQAVAVNTTTNNFDYPIDINITYDKNVVQDDEDICLAVMGTYTKKGAAAVGFVKCISKGNNGTLSGKINTVS
uniref:Ribonucleoside-diphosphate reductase large subunit n=1 Tax=Lygus hesperus TaxID=30085 RepID=A0A0A9XZZ6_LYGHE